MAISDCVHCATKRPHMFGWTLDRNSIAGSLTKRNVRSCRTASILPVPATAMQNLKVPKAASAVACHGRCQAHSKAFSSGRTPTSKRQFRYRQDHQLGRQRNHRPVLAAASTDIGTKAVQAINKSVGGDIFVAGTVYFPAELQLERCAMRSRSSSELPLPCAACCRRQWAAFSPYHPGAAARGFQSHSRQVNRITVPLTPAGHADLVCP